MLQLGVILTGSFILCLVSGAVSNPGTTRNIEEVFIGRCWEYLEIRKTRLNLPAVTNCTALWNTFVTAWAGKDPTKMKQSDYLFFFNAVKQPNINKILLWSGTYDVAHEYSRHVTYYATLEDTFLGYLVNGLSWCGKVCSGCPGIDYHSCPDNLHNEAGRAFWAGASETFASSLTANGSVQLMLNGSNPNRAAFDPSSYFALYELPNLPSTANIQVILVHDLEKQPTEHCNTGSLISLKKKIEAQNHQFQCVENPPAVLHLLCADDPHDSKCRFPGVYQTLNRSSRARNSLFTCLSVSSLLAYFTI